MLNHPTILDAHTKILFITTIAWLSMFVEVLSANRLRISDIALAVTMIPNKRDPITDTHPKANGLKNRSMNKRKNGASGVKIPANRISLVNKI